MKPWLLAVALGALRVVPGAAQDRPVALAVLPFENGGSYGRDREEFDALRKGLAAMLIGELARRPDLRLGDRSEIQRALDREGPAAAERVDKETAARIGRAVAARYVVAASFIDLYGDFRIDARLIDAGSGEVLKVVRSDPALHDRRDMHRMLRSVAERLGDGLLLPPLTTPTSGRPDRSVPTEALGFFSRALLYEDHGDRARSAEYYRRALGLFPEFAEAAEGLRRVTAVPPGPPGPPGPD